MIIVLGFIAIFVVLLVVGHIIDSEDVVSFTLFSGFVIGIGLLLALVFHPISVNGKIREFSAVKQTLEAARNNPDISAIELAAIQTEVIKINRWLANNQYYRNNPLTSWFIPKSVMKLEPIK